MREIKFRGKTEKGEWKVGLLTFMFGQYAIVDPIDENSVYLIDKETAGQYAELKDKNCVEIFEGDILRSDFNEGFEFFNEVIFEDGCFVSKYDGLLKHVVENAEVVGNRYENPEIIAKQKIEPN